MVGTRFTRNSARRGLVYRWKGKDGERKYEKDHLYERFPSKRWVIFSLTISILWLHNWLNKQ